VGGEKYRRHSKLFQEQGNIMSTVDRTNMHGLDHINAVASSETTTKSRTLAEAEAEIERLREELADAREELDSLTEVTSGFVRLMI
jgi:predicted  nucleic acid-binding Zn-ribbon protein